MSRTLGIDLASQPGRTAACLIEWDADRARVLEPAGEALTDETLFREIRAESVTKVAIDAPFGWPSPFVTAIAAYADELNWPGEDSRRLRFRASELHVLELTGKAPLSTVTERLVWATMRCARLLSELKDVDPEPRLGENLLLEAYPAAALFSWDLSPAEWVENPGSYKGPGADRLERRGRLMELLEAELEGIVDLGRIERFTESDDELDALICALVARAAELGQTESIPSPSVADAAAEGWLRLPSPGAGLASLAPSGSA